MSSLAMFSRHRSLGSSRLRREAAAALLALAAARVAARPCSAEEGLGHADAPKPPNSKWRVHDTMRPQPPMVAPGQQPGDPPADAVILFDGKDLSQWVGGNPKGVEQGVIDIARTGEMSTRRHFGDCQLHVEWATPAKADGGPMNWGNSGVFFLNSYELQIIESHDSRIYADGIAGAVYGLAPPLVNAARKPGQWQTYNVVFISPQFEGEKLVRPAYMTVFWNGVLVQCHKALQRLKAIRGSTSHPVFYDSCATTGPILLQYHNSAVRFRNIWVRPLKLDDDP